MKIDVSPMPFFRPADFTWQEVRTRRTLELIEELCRFPELGPERKRSCLKVKDLIGKFPRLSKKETSEGEKLIQSIIQGAIDSNEPEL